MTQISPEERQQAKAAAANAAVAANDVAVKIGITGVVAAGALVATGAGALAGVGVGVALAVGSFGAWWIGNRYQRLANDPPRDDFDIVSVSAATSSEAGQSTGDVEANARQLAIQQIMLADALDCLVTSLERHDGALAAENADAAQAQAVAARDNVAAVQAAQAAIAECAAVLNQAWQAAEVDWSTIDLAAVQALYLQSAGPPHQAPGDTLRGLLDTVTGLGGDGGYDDLDPASDPVMSLTELPPRPDVVVPAAFLDAMAELSSALDGLVNDDDQVA